MIYNLDNTNRVGNYVRVFDANGLEWDRCLECDTETGRILKFKTDENHNVLVDPQTDDLVREEIHVAAPLVVIPAAECNRPVPQVGNEIRYDGCNCDNEGLPSCPVFWKHEEDRIRVTERKTMARMNLPCKIFRRSDTERVRRGAALASRILQQEITDV